MSEKGVILIVDDTLTNLEVLFGCLTNAGFKILVAEDGMSAIENAKYALPDLILLDILMPSIDGFETCRRLKADEATAEIPVIFMTALSETVDKVKGFSIGAVDYITKPFQQEEVLARVQTHVSLRHLTRQLREQNTRLEQEIQERQRKETALSQSEERFRLLVEKVKDYAIFMLDPSGRVVSWNSGAERIKGYRADEIIGQLFSRFYPEADIQRGHPQWLLEIAVAEDQVEDEGWRVRKDGSRFWANTVITALRDEAGNLRGFTKVTRDITDRKRAEEDRLQFLAQEQQARAEAEAARNQSLNILESITDAFFALDRDWRYTYLNRQAELLLQRTREELLGQVMWDEFPEAVGSTFDLEYHRAVSQQVSVEFEAFYPPLNTWFEVHAYPSRDGLSVYFRNISDAVAAAAQRKRAEAALRESEERFHQAFENAAIGMALVSLDGRWLQVNRSLCEMLGYSEQELLALTFQAVTHSDDLHLGLNYFQQMLSGEITSCQFEKRYSHKLGHTVWGMLSSSMVRDGQNQPLYVVTQIEDITDRKQALEELRNLSKALESAVEGIAQLDTQGRYFKTNPAYASMLGYQPEELVRINWKQTIDPEELETVEAAYQRMLIDGKAEFEAKALRKDGTVFDKQVVIVKAYNQHQQFIGNYCFMKDISDRREIERLKDEFISVVSHELRTPLTSISAALDLLAGGVLQNQPEDAQQMLNIAANNSDRLVRLINDILDIERIESGKIVMTKQACDAGDLMNQSIEAIQEIAEKAGVTLSISPVSVRLWADPDRIIQVLTNLLSNAIKFSLQGSTVWLSAELIGGQASGVRRQGAESVYPSSSSDSDTLLIKVRDQGRGIPSDKLESIFERFQQVDASDSRQKGGTGLGLAICRSILQQHEGQIWAESTLGEGSTFCFTLPILSDVERPEFVPPLGGTASLTVLCPELGDSTQNSPLVLVCDDDSSVRTVVRAMLERQGYRVLTVASGQEAVEQSVAQPPDVILLNLMMPEMDGWETLAVLKNQTETQTIPVIILSGLLPDARETPHPGVSDWIVKPPEPRILRQALERVLADRNQTIKVLIVEDDLELAQILATVFSRHGIETFYAQTGRDAIHLSQRLLPDLLVLDLALPEYNGFAVVDWLRQHNRLRQVPLVVYTAQDLDESDRERLKLGQTLFLTKGRITSQEFEQRAIDLLNRMIRGKTGDTPT
ncbi:PAS domain S-box protein [Microcoleus sp. FACHB-SPT15]|uniref:PAS domain S-box protein n=1 Tax=Microcoleus sp. FACHB-SPT15 TaxID=2692830 RepID=UPI00177AF051|nr:PAS domain S-box protein [Microcoleus sp. FACHB-SPT15]MBD1804669.1 PAS domain S-box protein [Microcoleus sp. FACHB-SPT15]